MENFEELVEGINFDDIRNPDQAAPPFPMRVGKKFFSR